MGRTRVIIMGDAGRGFHSFNVHFRDNIDYQVIAFITPQMTSTEGRVYPTELAGKFYPNGIPLYHESQLNHLIVHHSVDEVIFAYDDVSHSKVMSKAAEVNSLGADFRLMGMVTTQIRSSKPVITVCAVHPRSGKSLVARQIAAELQKLKYKVVVVRHAMPSIMLQDVKRFFEYEDLDKYQCTIEEREEYEPYLDRGMVFTQGRITLQS